jgi:hypothetical protein
MDDLDVIVAGHLDACIEGDCSLCAALDEELTAHLSTLDDPAAFILDAMCDGSCLECELNGLGHAVVAFEWKKPSAA